MDWQNVINVGIGLIFAIGGWFCRQLWDSVKELKTDIAALRLHVSDAYVKKSEIDTIKSEMDKRFDRIELLLDRLFDKLEAKADK
jgi:hypothetical protein